MRAALFSLLSVCVFALTSPATQAQFSIFYEGDLATTSMTWTRPALDPGPDCALSSQGVDVRYEVQGFTTHAYEEDFNGTQDPWTFHIIRSEPFFNAVILLYRDAFDPADPCANLVAQNNNEQGDPVGPTLALELEEGVPYYLVTTSFSPDEFDSYTNTIESGIWYADLELIGLPDFADVDPGAVDWDAYWYLFPDLLDECEAVYSGDMVLSEFPWYTQARAFQPSVSGFYDLGFIAEGDYNDPIAFYDAYAYLYEGAYDRVNPCDYLYATTNRSADDGRIYLYTDYSLIDDVWLDAGQIYVLVGRVTEDLDASEISEYSEVEVGGWGPNGAVLTDLNALPALDLELDVIESPSSVVPGSTVQTVVKVKNNSGTVQEVDAWIELRASSFEGSPYEFRGTTPPDPVRIPKGFEGTVTYAVSIPKALSPDDTFLATFALGTFAADIRAGDIVEFAVSEGADATGATDWQLRRLSALADGAGEDAILGDGAYPNPFHPTTTIRFTLNAPEHATLTVYDVTGRAVAHLLNGADLDAGTHTARFDATGLASGVYVYRLDAGANVTTGRLTLLR